MYAEAKSLMWEVHHRMPAWKAEKLIESHKSGQVDLAVLGEATGILFESQEMLTEAVQYLEKIRKEKEGKEDADLGMPKTSDPHSSQSKDQETSDDDLKKQKETTSAPAGTASVVPNATGSSDGTQNNDPSSSSKKPAANNQQRDANASSTDPVTKEKSNSVSESPEDWFSRVTKEGQKVLWHPRASARCPTLLTGLQPSNLKSLETIGWEDKLESADLEKHVEYLRRRQFVAIPHPLEATAWENGFVPETHGLPSNELEPRMLPLLPQLSHWCLHPDNLLQPAMLF